jgi:hypothetical protein
MENGVFRCNKEWFVRTRTKAGGNQLVKVIDGFDEYWKSKRKKL